MFFIQQKHLQVNGLVDHFLKCILAPAGQSGFSGAKQATFQNKGRILIPCRDHVYKPVFASFFYRSV